MKIKNNNSSEPSLKNISRKKLIAISIGLIIIFAAGVFTAVYYWEQSKYLTVREFLRKAEYNHDPPGTIYYIQDVPTKSYITRIPNADGLLHSDISFDNITIITVVYFESGPNLLFFDDRRTDFPIGEKIKFSLVVITYTLPSGYFYTTIESHHIIVVLGYYDVEIWRGDFSPIIYYITEVNSTWKVKIQDMYNLFPLPLSWSDIMVEARVDDKKIESNVTLYDENNNLIGELGEDCNVSIDYLIEVGDYIEIRQELGTNSSLKVYFAAKTDIDPYFSLLSLHLGYIPP